MNVDQAAKLAHQFILVINVFIRLVNKHKEKAHTCHPIGKAMSGVVRKWLTGRS